MELINWIEAQKILSSQDEVFFVTFGTSWCGDCVMMEPVIDELETKVKSKWPNVTFIKVDADTTNFFRDVNSEWQIMKVPSFYFVKNSIKSHLGYEYVPIDYLFEQIQNIMTK